MPRSPNSPVQATSLACGAGIVKNRRNMYVTQGYGADLFRAANASIIFDESSNRFSPTYAPLMNRLLQGAGTHDVRLFNTRVLDGSPGVYAENCYDGRVIAFRNKVLTDILSAGVDSYLPCVILICMGPTCYSQRVS